ncbi:ATP-binding protein [Sphingomonas sp. RT2P30]|uniref:sensor histidine kinase n=1 Tax=Parasphingomonas halimpatiens TaxID=3096162 RepID=UPI002FC81244
MSREIHGEGRSRLRALEALAPTLIHEVSQPLTAASYYLEACAEQLRRRSTATDEVLTMIERAQEQTAKAIAIVTGMRNFAISGEIAGRPEELRGIIDSALAAVPEISTVNVVHAYSSASTHVVVDRLQVEQVLTNLFVNAVQAMEGSALRRLTISTRGTARETQIVVEDSGPGLVDDALGRLFEPFFTTKRQGMGLGLSICRTIVEAHGGRLWPNRPVKGRGATFNLTLPTSQV